MARHTVTESARLTGQSRRTIYQHIKRGSLSAQRSPSGTLVIDTAELVRAYGELHNDQSQSDTATHTSVSQMQSEIDRLNALLNEREQVNDLLRQQNGQLIRLLEDQSGGKRRSPLGTLTEALADRIRGGK